MHPDGRGGVSQGDLRRLHDGSMKTLCSDCQGGATGAEGHVLLVHHVGGPFPGQNIYKCAACDDRWIRHYGGSEGTFGWTRYADLFPSAIRRPSAPRKAPESLPF